MNDISWIYYLNRRGKDLKGYLNHHKIKNYKELTAHIKAIKNISFLLPSEKSIDNKLYYKELKNYKSAPIVEKLSDFKNDKTSEDASAKTVKKRAKTRRKTNTKSNNENKTNSEAE